MINESSFKLHLICFFFNLFVFSSRTSIAIDIFDSTQFIKDGETIVSAGENFELGFFSPGNSKNRYLGIWYKKIPVQTVVWVANRDNPITDSSRGVLKLNNNGNLILLNETSNIIIWSSNISETNSVQNPIVQLLDSGNLVIRDDEDYLWQSFDYPTDTLLSGMKVGWNLKTGENHLLASWKNSDDPSTGDYTFEIDRRGFPEGLLLHEQNPIYRTGPWNGVQFSGAPEMLPNKIISFNFVYNEDEIYYWYVLKSEEFVSRLVVNSTTGTLQRHVWQINTSDSWKLFTFLPKDQCDSYKECGVYGICDSNDPFLCKCVKGFVPKYPDEFSSRYGSNGCVKKTKFECQKGDGFFKMERMKLPDSSNVFLEKNMSLEDCRNLCWKNCSCKAYANSNVTNGGSGCVLWVDDLVDMRQFTVGGQDIYIRVAASELVDEDGSRNSSTNANPDTKKKKKHVTVIILVTVLIGILLLSLIWYCWFKWGNSLKAILWKRTNKDQVNNDEDNLEELELPSFQLCTLSAATYNFCDENKLGEGGFGSVYKGTLPDQQEIAVKRLSKNSIQGVEEFKNEVKLIARLQHRNLVRLLGCCFEGEEKMLIYEYMPNKCLDSTLFNKPNGSSLDWEKRFNIICGIARGLLYLHQDSRFRIIHRDLKGSNVLLDKEMNPKISDFGIARIFRGDETEVNTKRVVGTYGYMSPEYAMHGRFSVKSDVFSFGVLVLEIVCGAKNRLFCDSENEHNLLAHAWSLWKAGRALELMDASLGGDSITIPTHQVLRCIQVGLMCVQERAQDRPIMANVVSILSNNDDDEHSKLQFEPKQPGFALLDIPSTEFDACSSKKKDLCTSDQTITILEPR